MKSIGPLTILLFSTLMTVAFSAASVAQTVSPSYLGCFKDTYDRDLSGYSQEDARLTLGSCTNTCRQKGFRYAATQYGSQCFCGNSYGKYGTATNCDMPCAGNSSEICGGFWANSVYDLATAGTTLTGVWKDENGAVYSIRQVGNQVWWYMDGRPRYTNVFRGNRSADTITGEWVDVPGGRVEGDVVGSLALRIVNDNRLEKVSASPAYGGSVWTRLY